MEVKGRFLCTTLVHVLSRASFSRIVLLVYWHNQSSVLTISYWFHEPLLTCCPVPVWLSSSRHHVIKVTETVFVSGISDHHWPSMLLTLPLLHFCYYGAAQSNSDLSTDPRQSPIWFGRVRLDPIQVELSHTPSQSYLEVRFTDQRKVVTSYTVCMIESRLYTNKLGQIMKITFC